MRIKYYEWNRHGLTEPLLTVNLFKKVEDGKVVACFRFMYYLNAILVVYEDDRYRGGELMEIVPSNVENLKKVLSKYYDDRDDLIIIGERSVGEKLLEAIEQG